MYDGGVSRTCFCNTPHSSLLSFCLQISLSFLLSIEKKKDPLNSLTFTYSHMLYSISAVIFMLITNKAATVILLPPAYFQTQQHFLKNMCCKKWEKSNHQRLIKVLNSHCTVRPQGPPTINTELAEAQLK